MLRKQIGLQYIYTTFIMHVKELRVSAVFTCIIKDCVVCNPIYFLHIRIFDHNWDVLPKN